MSVPVLVVCTPSVQDLHRELRDLGIPPHPFLRRGVVVVTGLGSMEHVRGLTYHWTCVPGHDPGTDMADTLSIHSRTHGGGRLEWTVSVARSLAWRMYHEC
jgi:hypothetical protein